MKAVDVNHTLIEGYLRLLENLSPSNKLELISKLKLSVKSDISKRKKRFYKAFGAWESDGTAEDLIKDIKAARTLKRKIEGL